MTTKPRQTTAATTFPGWAVKLLKCPITHEGLSPAEDELVTALQRLKQAGKLINQQGAACDIEFNAGLVNGSRSYFHPARNGIQTLIPHEAIAVKQLELLQE